MRPTTLKLLVLLVCTMIAAVATAQEIETTITLDRNSDQFSFDLAVLNSSPVEMVQSVTVTLEGGARFDDENPQTFVSQVSPDIGTNNDGLSSDTVTWTPGRPLEQGGLLEVNGDIDPSEQASGVTATVNFTSGAVRTVRLSGSGDRWTGQISEGGQPDSPIINGEATVTLSWTPPTQYENGTALPQEDIEGYVLYWDELSRVGRCGNYPASKLDTQCYGSNLDLTNGNTSTSVLTLSLDGDTTMYFTIMAYIAGSGTEALSSYSNEVRRVFTVEVTEPPTPTPGAPILQDVQMAITCTTSEPGWTCEFTVE